MADKGAQRNVGKATMGTSPRDLSHASFAEPPRKKRNGHGERMRDAIFFSDGH